MASNARAGREAKSRRQFRLAIIEARFTLSEAMSKILGIDLGTTNSCMSVMVGGEPVVLENSEGARTTPSVVAFSKTGEVLVGQAAKRQAVMNPTNTIFSVKRFMGRTFDEVRDELHRVPYKVVESANGNANIQVLVNGGTKTFSPPEISAMILAKLKSDAEDKLGETIKQAVITVPSYFNDSQRNATKAAGEIAGLEVLRIINEPDAASIGYGLNKIEKHYIGVYDLGGGGFSVSFLDVEDGVFEVLSTNGETHLGGDEWDNALMDWIFHKFNAENGIDLSKLPDATQRVREAIEDSKISLSSSQEYEINVPFIVTELTGPKHLQIKLTRSIMELLTFKLIERTIVATRECMKEAGLANEDISQLILVGGMTRMPKVIATARALIGKEPHKGVNADEAVAIGAAIQGGVLRGDVRDVLYLEVTPFTLSIETAGSRATPIIERNSTIPSKKSMIFSTASDNQSSIAIVVLEGQCPMSKDNRKLGTFHFDGIPLAPRGKPQIEVTFAIGPNSDLQVSAKDIGTGKEQKFAITGRSECGTVSAAENKKRGEIIPSSAPSPSP
jgi:molecular chaperone DnaK